MKLFMLLTALVLAACGRVEIADQAHTVDEYYADAELAATTIEACRARSEAELQVLAKKPACKNVWAAERRRGEVAVEKSTGDWNAWARGELERKRLAREGSAPGASR